MTALARAIDDRTLASFPGATELLAALSPEVSETLAGLMRPLLTVLGRVAASEAAGPEPTGIGDLATRGRYERLLVSEWLLAGELPEEFDRRAAMGEHLFLAPERRGPTFPVRTVVLFDAGPSQLGRPRIVQLAALLAFAVRARIARVPLEVGILQSGSLRAPDLDALLALVAARSFEMAKPDDLERLGPFDAGDDLWLVGGAGLPPAPGAQCLLLADDEDAVHLAVSRRGTSVVRRTVSVLPTPGALLALRDPRRRLVPSSPPRDLPARGRLGDRVHASAPFVFSSDGRHLLVRVPESVFVAHRLRNGPYDPSTLRYPLRGPAGERALLAEHGHFGRALLTMSPGGDRLSLHLLGKRGGAKPGASFGYEAPPASVFAGPVEPRLLLPRLEGTRAVFLDAQGRLWRLPEQGDPTVIAWDVEAIAASFGGFVFAARSSGEGRAPEALRFTRVTRVPAYGALAPNDDERGSGRWLHDLPGGRFVAWDTCFRALCRTREGDSAIVSERGEIVRLRHTEGLVCHGVPGWAPETLLASVAEELVLLARDGTRRSFARMGSPIVRVVVGVDNRRVAVEDSEGHIVIFAGTGERLLRLSRARP